MAEYQCQETSSICTKFQSAICLHCNLRLCALHITEHNQSTPRNDVEKLSNSAEVIHQQIKNKSDKSREIHNSLVLSIDKWQVDELAKIEQIYHHELQIMNLRQKTLETLHKYLLVQLEFNARQTLDRIRINKNLNIKVFNHIQKIIQKVREDSVHLKWHFSTPITAKIDSNFPFIPSQIQLPITNLNSTNDKQSITDTKKTCQPIKSQRVRPDKYLIDRFSSTSSIATSKSDIKLYIKEKNLKLLIIVDAYLTACHNKPLAEEKLSLLNEYISTIRRYLRRNETNFDILIGIQLFFLNNIFHDNEKNGIMSFLLQFFINHQCINQKLIIEWYNSNEGSQYEGFEQAKQLAKSYINTFSMINENSQAIAL
ncbi:unnamed protein product [Adineta steineri]|uniref:Uncharacterized protein n=1 Tax=Adineta steineri TaxID=433720 RepID=A0A814GN00_9BILA|nr:unnamed protein product [Adineta steineri]CAF0998453.1 unnamed protein product [Adineta steineri]